MTMLAAALAVTAALSMTGEARAIPVADQAAARPAVELAQHTAKPKARHIAKRTAKPVLAKPKQADPRIGEVTVVDIPGDPYLRLDGPWRERGYELRTWLTSYVYRPQDIRPPFHMLTVQLTHHDETARNYGAARTAAEDTLDIAVATRPNRQCVKNRDGSRLCFLTEGYTVNMPDALLAAARTKGVTLRLDAEGKESLAVDVDAVAVEAQLKAVEGVSKR